jgi:hypothetical protein
MSEAGAGAQSRGEEMPERSAPFRETVVDVSGFFTTHHHLRTEAGTWGKLKFPAFSDHAVFGAAGGRELMMRKSHWLGTAHELIEGKRVRGRADRRGMLRTDIVVEFDGREYTLEPEGVLKDGWFLADQAGNRLLEIRPRGVFREGAFLTTLGAVSMDLIAFAYYLVHMRKQEDAAVVASTAAVS